MKNIYKIIFLIVYILIQNLSELKIKFNYITSAPTAPFDGRRKVPHAVAYASGTGTFPPFQYFNEAY